MKTLTLKIPEATYRALRSEVTVHFLCHQEKMPPLEKLAAMIVEAIETERDELVLPKAKGMKDEDSEDDSAGSD